MDYSIVRAQQEKYANISREVVDSESSSVDGMTTISALRKSYPSDEAIHIRDFFMEYVNTNVGYLSWQFQYIFRTKMHVSVLLHCCDEFYVRNCIAVINIF